MREDRGFALLLVLWLALAVGGLALVLARTEREAVTRQALVVDQSRLDLAARSLLPEILTALARGELGAGARLERRLGELELVVRITGESGRVDLNAATPATLEALLAAHGVPPEQRLRLRDALLDWRDGDSLVRLAGAEVEAYRRAGRPGPANRPLYHPAELVTVLGFTPELVRRLWPDVTTFTGRAEVAPALASPALRRALGLDPAGAAASGVDPAGVYRLDIRVRRGDAAVRRIELVVRRERAGWTVLDWAAPRALGEGGA